MENDHVCTVCFQGASRHPEACGACGGRHWPSLCCEGCDCRSFEETHSALDASFICAIREAPQGPFVRLALTNGPPSGVDADVVAPALFEAWGQDAQIEPAPQWIERWVEQGLLPKVELMIRVVRAMNDLDARLHITTLPWSEEELEFGTDYAVMAYPGWMDNRAIQEARSGFSRPVPTTEAAQEYLMDELIDYFGMNPCAEGWRMDGKYRWYKVDSGDTEHA